jgi:two-component system, OmpR family, sensor kinase
MKLEPRWAGRLRRGRRVKLRTRVLAGVLGITLTALVAFDIAAVTALRGYLIGQTDAQLQSVLNVYRLVDTILTGPAHAALGRRPPGTHIRIPQQRPAPKSAAVPEKVLAPPSLQPFSFMEIFRGKSEVVGPVITIRGLTVGNNPGLVPVLPRNLPALASSGQGVSVVSEYTHQPLRLMAMPVPPGRLVPRGTILVAATSLDGVNKTVGQLELILIIGSAAAGLLAAAGTAWLMRRGLRPVERMAGQADKITAGDLTGRVSPRDPRTEVGRLGVALNRMLARIEDSVAEREASQRASTRFFADASHELRTPLASLRANAELYQQGALPEREQVDEAMRRIVSEARRMGVLVDDMLRLARLDQHPERRDEPVDVTGLAGECVQRARTAHPEWTWHARVAAGLAASGDEELLRRAIDNLLANVAAHTPPGSAALLTADLSGDALTIEVSDDGPGVPEDKLDGIFDRFYRAGAPSRRPGSGLGLAIVAAAMAAHDGAVHAAPSQPTGLRVTLVLPASDPPDLDGVIAGQVRSNGSG